MKKFMGLFFIVSFCLHIHAGNFDYYVKPLMHVLSSIKSTCNSWNSQTHKVLTEFWHTSSSINWSSINWRNPKTIKVGVSAAIATAAICCVIKLIRSVWSYTRKTDRAEHGSATNRPTQSVNPTGQPVTVVEIPKTQLQDIPHQTQTHQPITHSSEQPKQVLLLNQTTVYYLENVPYFCDLSHHVIPPVTFKNHDTLDTVTVQQMRVLSQQNSDSKHGDNSCGYHAGVKNASALAGLIQGQEISDMLTNPTIAQTLFNPNEKNPGLLRAWVIATRKATRLLESFKAQHRNAITSRGDPRIAALYDTLITQYLYQSSSEAISSNKPKSLTLEDFIKFIQQTPINISDITSASLGRERESLLGFLRSEDTIRQFINFEEKLLIEPPTTEQRVQEIPGDWLTSQEIGQLIEYQRIHDPHNTFGENVQIEILESLEQITQSFESSGGHVQDGSIPQLRRFIHDNQLPSKRLFIFVIGTMKQTGESSSSSGHWVTMALEIARNARRYTITDSADNHIRMFDTSMHDNPCFELIKYLEGDCVTRLLQPSQECKVQMRAQLMANLAQLKTEKNETSRGKLFESLDRYDTYVGDYSMIEGGRDIFIQALAASFS